MSERYIPKEVSYELAEGVTPEQAHAAFAATYGDDIERGGVMITPDPERTHANGEPVLHFHAKWLEKNPDFDTRTLLQRRASRGSGRIAPRWQRAS